MWWTINTLVFLTGAWLFHKGWHESREVDAYDSLLHIAGGAALLVLGIASVAVKWVWF